MSVSKQLRLITNELTTDRAGDGAGGAVTLRGRVQRTPRARSAKGSASRGRRAVRWESAWRLDERTRAIGRAGVASARAALARAHQADDLPRAS